jgi:hypothetical protein
LLLLVGTSLAYIILVSDGRPSRKLQIQRQQHQQIEILTMNW